MHQRFTLAAPAGRSLPTDVVSYGADIPREDELRLLGQVAGKRVLDLGCGAGHNAIALARAGARVIAVDATASQIDQARAACEDAELKVELHHAPLAELAFVRADTVDLAISAYGLATVSDLDRVFRQVDRVLKPECHFVLSLPHPASLLLDLDDPERKVARSYWETAAVPAGDGPPVQPRTLAGLVTSLTRANFRVDNLLEPQPSTRGPRSAAWSPAYELVPPTVIVRARKQGL